LTAATVNYSLNGIPVAFDPSEPAQTGLFRLTSTGGYLSFDIDLGGLGARIAGGQFTRGQWRSIVEAERKRRDDERKAREAEETQRREVARKAAAKRRTEIDAARRAEDQANAERARRQTIIDALAAAAGAQSIGAIAPAIAAAHAKHLQDERDEEEAVIRLLLLE
jgi:hypothetical protein